MTITDLPPSDLLDRRSEREVPDRLAAGVLSGQSRVRSLRAEAFTERARRDLRTTGGEATGRQPGRASDALNPQEAQFTGVGMGSQMLISPLTVEHYLRTVLGQLDVGLRRELGDGTMPL